MLSLLGYRLFNQPEICSGDQSRISLLATIVRSFLWLAKGKPWAAELTSRPADRPRRLGSADGRRAVPPPGSRRRSRRSSPAISRIDEPEAMPSEMSSRSANVSVLGAVTNGRNNPAVLRQQELNRWLELHDLQEAVYLGTNIVGRLCRQLLRNCHNYRKGRSAVEFARPAANSDRPIILLCELGGHPQIRAHSNMRARKRPQMRISTSKEERQEPSLGLDACPAPFCRSNA